MPSQPLHSLFSGAFELDNDRAYAAWRARKLELAASTHEFVEIRDITALSGTERKRLTGACRERNYGLFRIPGGLRDAEHELDQLGHQLGLNSLDRNLCAEDSGVTAITVKDTHTEHGYIPYSNREMGWHTDGYYNDHAAQIRGMLLYCAQQAATGGDNELLDHEMAYIRLRDQNPDWIRALMAADVFTIPANFENGLEIHPARSGPVFSVADDDGALHMRYSARQRNVIWRDDPLTRAATAALTALLGGSDEHLLRYRLNPGEGILSNNVLHRRSGFSDDAASGHKRLIYRARYRARIATT